MADYVEVTTHARYEPHPEDGYPDLVGFYEPADRLPAVTSSGESVFDANFDALHCHRAEACAGFEGGYGNLIGWGLEGENETWSACWVAPDGALICEDCYGNESEGQS